MTTTLLFAATTERAGWELWAAITIAILGAVGLYYFIRSLGKDREKITAEWREIAESLGMESGPALGIPSIIGETAGRKVTIDRVTESLGGKRTGLYIYCEVELEPVFREQFTVSTNSMLFEVAASMFSVSQEPSELWVSADDALGVQELLDSEFCGGRTLRQELLSRREKLERIRLTERAVRLGKCDIIADDPRAVKSLIAESLDFAIRLENTALKRSRAALN
jgi:hypothetical protein